MCGWKPCLLAIALIPSLALAQAQAEKAPGPQAGYPRQLTGKELAGHFEGDWSASGATSRATPITFYNNSDGTIRIQQHNQARAPHGFGTRRIKASENQVCLDITTTTWRGVTGCYYLFETEPKAYALRYAKGSFRIEYRR